eukprot:TRINITY_DN7135_c0_g1_i2.p1 TRINITY_DN7135_c0_g1~~TRINITY_DN7135_c0_g1_i2.p1  ORF type:complete len:292 (+),score=25.67 TRINITY_DN7135_c0_g1_i2:412-1287(+)
MTYQQHFYGKQEQPKNDMFAAKKDKLQKRQRGDKGGSQSYLDVPHVKQLFSWDCGVACTLMVLKALNLDNGIGIIQLQQMFNTHSIWTIDIAHMLRRYAVEVTFYTVTIGANPDFANEKYYMLHMSEDTQRVERLFQQAPNIGLPILKRSLSMKEIIDFITTKQYLIILLLDLRKISSWLSAADSCFMSTCCGCNGLGYQGHYIVLCGYDKQRQQFLYMDPGGRNGVQRQSVEAVEEARKSYGTDEDLLLINTQVRISSQQEMNIMHGNREEILMPPNGGQSEEHQSMLRS